MHRDTSNALVKCGCTCHNPYRNTTSEASALPQQTQCDHLIWQKRCMRCDAREQIDGIVSGGTGLPIPVKNETAKMTNEESWEDKEFLESMISENLDAWIDEMPDTELPPSTKFLMGQIMKISKGKANPIVARRQLIKRLIWGPSHSDLKAQGEMLTQVAKKEREEGKCEELKEQLEIIKQKLKDDSYCPDVLVAGIIYWQSVAETRLQATNVETDPESC